MPTVAAIQMNSKANVTNNLRMATQLIDQAVDTGAKLLVLPEMFAVMGATEIDKVDIKETIGEGVIQDFLADQAKRHGIWIIGGTIPLSSGDPNKISAACLVYDALGQCVARYDKMHLFDAVITKSVEEYCESATTVAGDSVVVIDTPIGRLGIAVCYDVRFPELFRLMFNQGAEIFAIPAAFTVKTGQAHWRLLARSRAVENFCYVVGACQVGAHGNGRRTYGHSLIIDPWGEILSELDNDVGIIYADVDLDYLREIRRHMPVQNHQRIKISN